MWYYWTELEAVLSERANIMTFVWLDSGFDGDRYRVVLHPPPDCRSGSIYPWSGWVSRWRGQYHQPRLYCGKGKPSPDFMWEDDMLISNIWTVLHTSQFFIFYSSDLFSELTRVPYFACCTLLQSPKPPEYIFWYHNDRMINYVASPEVTVHTEPGAGKTHSRLIIRKALLSHSGNYTCKAANADPASILVFVSQGMSPSATRISTSIKN